LKARFFASQALCDQRLSTKRFLLFTGFFFHANGTSITSRNAKQVSNSQASLALAANIPNNDAFVIDSDGFQEWAGRQQSSVIEHRTDHSDEKVILRSFAYAASVLLRICWMIKRVYALSPPMFVQQQQWRPLRSKNT